jgi:FlaA1/EpsC-like NDP-sugar epimerase
MTIEATPPRAGAQVSPSAARLSARLDGDLASYLEAPRFGRRHRYLLQVADLLTLSVSAALGAVMLTNFSPIRAGHLGLREVVLAIAAMAIALHLHGLYRRPASTLRPSGWWRPTVIARCVPTGALLTLAAGAAFLESGRMTLTAAVAMTLPAVAFVPFGRRLVVRMFDPTVTRILVIGTGPITDRLTSRLRRCPDTVVVGHVDDNVPAPKSSVD